MRRCNTKHSKSLGRREASIEATGWPIQTRIGSEMIHGPQGAAPGGPGHRERRGLWVVAFLVGRVPDKTFCFGEKKHN